MKVYITYFRYDRNENFCIHDIGYDKDESIERYQKELLPDFLSYGPDDVSYFILKVVDLTTDEHEELIRVSTIEESDYNEELIRFMTDIHERDGEELLYVTGELNWEVLDFFIRSGLYDLNELLGVDTSTLSEDDLSELCQEKLWYDSNDDESLFRKVLQDFLNN